MPKTIYVGLHEKADNPRSFTGWHSTALDMLSKSFNDNLREYQDSLKPGGKIKTASAEKRLLVDAVYHEPFSFSSKIADFADGPNTGEIEQALAKITEAQIAARAPALMSYLLGFQLLKKTDDNTRACGIFAFKVGQELLYIPVFCINGEIQGHELMYIVTQDRFVPSDEKQVNYLMSRKPLEPGKVEMRDRSKIRQRAAIYPDVMYGGLKLSSIDTIPRLPKAMVEEALRLVFKTASCDIVMNTPRFRYAMGGLNVSDLFALSAKATKIASKWCEEYPVFERLLTYALDGQDIKSFNKEWEKRAAIAKELGLVPVQVKKATLQSVMTAATKKEESLPEPARVSVKMASEMPLDQFRFMPTEAVDRLHRRGYYVVDTRDQTKLAAVAESKGVKDIKNPHLPGFYNVFMPDGTFKKCVVLHRWYLPGGEDTLEELRFFVLDTDTGKYVDAKGSDIIVDNEQPEGDWFAAVSKGSLPEKKEDVGCVVACSRRCLLVSPSGQGYLEEYLEESGKGSFIGHRVRVFTTSGQTGFKCVSALGRWGDIVVSAQQDSKLVRYDKELILGDLLQWEELLYKNTIPLKVQKRDRQTGRYSVDGMPEYDKAAALEALMVNHSLSEKTAEHILERADASAPLQVSFRRTKVAFSPSQEQIGVNFPTKPRSTDWLTGLPSEHPLETSEHIESLRSTDPLAGRDFWPGAIDVDDVNDHPPMPNVGDIQMATQASESGQREFVSSQMLMSLLREVDDEGIITKYISVFEKACDALGRLYMQVLWRVDAFEERFGEAQLKEFKEMLLELFQRIGDFVCYLRQRDVRPESRIALEHITDIGSDYGGQD